MNSVVLMLVFMINQDKVGYITDNFQDEKSCQERLQERITELGDQVLMGECY